MSNYDYDDRSPQTIPVEDSETIQKFFGGGVNCTTHCPRCGASVAWSQFSAANMLLHIKWHENLAAMLTHQSKPYLGLKM